MTSIEHGGLISQRIPLGLAYERYGKDEFLELVEHGSRLEEEGYFISLSYSNTCLFHTCVYICLLISVYLFSL